MQWLRDSRLLRIVLIVTAVVVDLVMTWGDTHGQDRLYWVSRGAHASTPGVCVLPGACRDLLGFRTSYT
jgi:hypothetical protein